MDKPKLVHGTQETKEKIEVKKNEVAKVAATNTKKNSNSNQVTQREAVYLEVMKIVREEKIVVTESQAFKAILNENQLKKIYSGLMEGFRNSKIALKATVGNKQKLADSKKLEVYVIGLVNNWMRRDKRLNGTMNSKK